MPSSTCPPAHRVATRARIPAPAQRLKWSTRGDGPKSRKRLLCPSLKSYLCPCRWTGVCGQPGRVSRSPFFDSVFLEGELPRSRGERVFPGGRVRSPNGWWTGAAGPCELFLNWIAIGRRRSRRPMSCLEDRLEAVRSLLYEKCWCSTAGCVSGAVPGAACLWLEKD